MNATQKKGKVEMKSEAKIDGKKIVTKAAIKKLKVVNGKKEVQVKKIKEKGKSSEQVNVRSTWNVNSVLQHACVLMGMLGMGKMKNGTKVLFTDGKTIKTLHAHASKHPEAHRDSAQGEKGMDEKRMSVRGILFQKAEQRGVLVTTGVRTLRMREVSASLSNSICGLVIEDADLLRLHLKELNK